MFKKLDFFLIAAIAIFVLSFAAYNLYHVKQHNDILSVVVYQDKKPLKSFKLNIASEDYSFEAKNEFGFNIINVQKGAVFISDADCKNKDCVKIGKISKVNDFIICLPHKLLIRIEGETDIEAVSY